MSEIKLYFKEEEKIAFLRKNGWSLLEVDTRDDHSSVSVLGGNLIKTSKVVVAFMNYEILNKFVDTYSDKKYVPLEIVEHSSVDVCFEYALRKKLLEL